MTPSHQTAPPQGSIGPVWRFVAWFLGIVGGIAAFLGLFVFFAGEDSYIGLGGDWSWRVGDISTAWAYGLLIGGIVFVLATLGIVMFAPKTSTRSETKGGLTDLVWHAVIFVFVNAFLWVQDLALGEGIDYAYWVTIFWGVGLLAHALAYFWSEARSEDQGDELAPAEEMKELQHH